MDCVAGLEDLDALERRRWRRWGRKGSDIWGGESNRVVKSMEEERETKGKTK